MADEEAVDHGVQIAQGSYDEVSTNEQVIEAYLGTSVEDLG